MGDRDPIVRELGRWEKSDCNLCILRKKMWVKRQNLKQVIHVDSGK